MTQVIALKNPLALVIEDDIEQLAIFTHALQLAEFETEAIRDGQKALNRLAETEPSVVILDLHLPYVSGKEILRRIRTSDRLQETKIILATADHAAAEIIRQDADLVLIKPISFIQLRDLAMRLRPDDTRLE